MTLHELLTSPESSPLVSFHDARFLSVYVDWVTRQATFACNLLTGSPDAPTPQEREATRNGVLTLTGLHYLVIEPPDPAYPFEESPRGLDIAADGDTATLPVPAALPPLNDPAAFTHYFWVNDWNAFLYVAATGARFAWAEH